MSTRVPEVLAQEESVCAGAGSQVGTEPGQVNRGTNGLLALPGPPSLSWSFLGLTSTVEGSFSFVLRYFSYWDIFSKLEEVELKANGEMCL